MVIRLGKLFQEQVSLPDMRGGLLNRIKNFVHQGPAHKDSRALLTGCHVPAGADGYNEQVTPRRMLVTDGYREHLRKKGHKIPQPKRGERIIFRPIKQELTVFVLSGHNMLLLGILMGRRSRRKICSNSDKN